MQQNHLPLPWPRCESHGFPCPHYTLTSRWRLPETWGFGTRQAGAWRAQRCGLCESCERVALVNISALECRARDVPHRGPIDEPLRRAKYAHLSATCFEEVCAG